MCLIYTSWLLLVFLFLSYALLIRGATTKIFIGNIKDGTTNQLLRELFEVYGTVTEADIVGGFGFIVSSKLMLFVVVSYECRL